MWKVASDTTVDTFHFWNAVCFVLSALLRSSAHSDLGESRVPQLYLGCSRAPPLKAFPPCAFFFFSFSFGRGVLTNLECGNTVSIAVTQSQKYGHLVTQKSQKGKNKKSELHPKSQLARPKLFYVQEL